MNVNQESQLAYAQLVNPLTTLFATENKNTKRQMLNTGATGAILNVKTNAGDYTLLKLKKK